MRGRNWPIVTIHFRTGKKFQIAAVPNQLYKSRFIGSTRPIADISDWLLYGDE
jgi:hypothetical protein